jgi:hypothetical protein
MITTAKNSSLMCNEKGMLTEVSPEEADSSQDAVLKTTVMSGRHELN